MPTITFQVGDHTTDDLAHLRTNGLSCTGAIRTGLTWLLDWWATAGPDEACPTRPGSHHLPTVALTPSDTAYDDTSGSPATHHCYLTHDDLLLTSVFCDLTGHTREDIWRHAICVARTLTDHDIEPAVTPDPTGPTPDVRWYQPASGFTLIEAVIVSSLLSVALLGALILIGTFSQTLTADVTRAQHDRQFILTDQQLTTDLAAVVPCRPDQPIFTIDPALPDQFRFTVRTDPTGPLTHLTYQLDAGALIRTEQLDHDCAPTGQSYPTVLLDGLTPDSDLTPVGCPEPDPADPDPGPVGCTPRALRATLTLTGPGGAASTLTRTWPTTATR